MSISLKCLYFQLALLLAAGLVFPVTGQLSHSAGYAYSSKAEYGVGEDVTFGLRNIGNSTIYLSSAPGPWVILTRDGLQPVYHNPSFLEVLVPIGPSNSKEWIWNQKADDGRQVDEGSYLFEIAGYSDGFGQNLYFYTEIIIVHAQPTHSMNPFDVKFRGFVWSIDSPCCDRGTFENITITAVLADPMAVLHTGSNITVQYCGPCLLPGNPDVEQHGIGEMVEVFGSYNPETGWITLARDRPDHYIHKASAPLALNPLILLTVCSVALAGVALTTKPLTPSRK